MKRRIILGLTGGIAAYKAAELARLLVKQEVDVRVAMTEAACHFITPATMQALTGHPVLVNQWEGAGGGMVHIEASRTADAIMIAPATADFIAKLAHGLADDLLSTMCLARDCPLFIAPAMNRQMWENAATQRNIGQLVTDGVTILGPASGVQACGEEGMGRMLEAGELASKLIAFLRTKEPSTALVPWPLANMNIVITAGPTYEPIDAVRGITNRSSGKMGYAVAEAALEMGARVTLISGPTALEKPQGAEVVNVESANQMLEAVKQHLAGCDIFIGVAAVADYRAAQPSVQKIKKNGGNLTLELVPNPDILAYVAGLPDPPFCVGFAAESEHLAEYAEQKRRAKKLPLLVGNLAQQSIGSAEAELELFDDNGRQTLPRADKHIQARLLMRYIAQHTRGTIK